MCWLIFTRSWYREREKQGHYGILIEFFKFNCNFSYFAFMSPKIKKNTRRVLCSAFHIVALRQKIPWTINFRPDSIYVRESKIRIRVKYQILPSSAGVAKAHGNSGRIMQHLPFRASTFTSHNCILISCSLAGNVFIWYLNWIHTPGGRLRATTF